MLKKKNRRFLAFVLLIPLVFSCDSKVVFDSYKSLPNQWDKNNEISFVFKAPDSTNVYNLFINVRNNSDYKFSNLFLITAFNYPNGKTFIDTLEYKMAAVNGELLGTGFTDIKHNKLWYKGFEKPFQFKELGEYTMTIQQAMRKNGDLNGVEELEGITDVGFRVENK
jgi:gliding motility-associated lipoprotein GldH